MKLILQIITALLILSIITSSLRTNKSKDNHNDKADTKASETFKVAPPIEKLGTPTYREYRKPSDLFRSVKKELHKMPGAVAMTNRECNALCTDRIVESCPLGVEARAAKSGIVECVCKREGEGNSLVFPQEDQCYSAKACFSKSTFETCYK